jgi:hypothetical protein
MLRAGVAFAIVAVGATLALVALTALLDKTLPGQRLIP